MGVMSSIQKILYVSLELVLVRIRLSLDVVLNLCYLREYIHGKLSIAGKGLLQMFHRTLKLYSVVDIAYEPSGNSGIERYATQASVCITCVVICIAEVHIIDDTSTGLSTCRRRPFLSRTQDLLWPNRLGGR